jgi:hypothetical protein
MDRKLNKAEMLALAYLQQRVDRAERELAARRNHLADIVASLGVPGGSPFRVEPDGTVVFPPEIGAFVTATAEDPADGEALLDAILGGGPHS